MIAAKNAESLRILNQKIKDRELSKKYLCIATGYFEKKEDTLKRVPFLRMRNRKRYMLQRPRKKGQNPYLHSTRC